MSPARQEARRRSGCLEAGGQEEDRQRRPLRRRRRSPLSRAGTKPSATGDVPGRAAAARTAPARRDPDRVRAATAARACPTRCRRSTRSPEERRAASPSSSTPTFPGCSATAPGRTAKTGWRRRSPTATCRCSTPSGASPRAAAATSSPSRSRRCSPRCSPTGVCAPLVERYLAERTKAAWEARTRHPLALWWHGEFERLRAIWDSFHHDLVRAFGELADQRSDRALDLGRHPRLSAARPQLQARPPRPAHRPREPPRALRQRSARLLDARVRLPPRRPLAAPGDRPLRGGAARQRGLPRGAGAATGRWSTRTCLRAGDPAFPYQSDLPPEEVVEPGGPHPKPYWIRRSSVAAFLRDARTAAQVWSRQGGYPGDGAFLDFHKRHWPSGLRFWRVTGDETDMLRQARLLAAGRRRPRARAGRAFRRAGAAALDGMDGGVVCAPVRRRALRPLVVRGPDLARARARARQRRGARVEATTPSRELDAGPSLRRAFFDEGSWGAGGDHRVWVNAETDWFWRELADARAPRLRRGALARRPQVAARDPQPAAARRRFRLAFPGDHGHRPRLRRAALPRARARLRELIDLGPRTRWLPDWVDGDLPFPDLEPEWALPPDF